MTKTLDDVNATLREALPKVARSRTLALKAPRLRRSAEIAVARFAGGPGEPHALHALPVYSTTPAALKREGFAKLRQTGWTSLLDAGEDGVVAAADVDAETAAFAGVASGPDIDDFAKRAKALAAEAHGGTIAQLKLPSIYLLAIWLRASAEPGEGDVVIPVGKAYAPFHAGRRYGLQEFINLLPG